MARVRFVLGLDLATNTGWAWGASAGFRAAGVLRLGAEAGKSRAARLAWFDEWLREELRRPPALVVYEKPITHRKNLSGADLAKNLEGVLLAATAQARIRVCSLTPSELKKAFTNDGRASKEAMVARAAALFQDELDHPLTDNNEADALALVTWGLEKGFPHARDRSGRPRPRGRAAPPRTALSRRRAARTHRAPRR